MARHLSTFAIAEMLKVDPGSIANWIDQGLLKAHRTPGGHRRVAADDLLKFLTAHDMPLPPELGVKPVPKRVLVVDDEPAITQMISRAIKAQHPEYEVVEAHDGFRAGTIVATLQPNVVILDLRMPGIDGFEVCRQIKSGGHDPHVLAMTAYPSPESEKKILECGARVCLSKPLNIDILLTEVESAVR